MRYSSTTLLPSILVELTRDDKVSTLEVFGPTTCVYLFTELDEAISDANSLPIAFQASIFTGISPHRIRRRLGAVMVNDHVAFRTDWMPFAGRRESGSRIGGIPWAIWEMAEEKMIVFRM